MRRSTALLLAPAMLAACQPASTGAENGTPVLSYENAYIMAPVGGRDVSVGGISISVEGGDVTLTGASSDVAETVETHTMAMDDGTMKMRPVESYELKAGDTLVFERGSDHLMLFGVDPDIASGDTANITFDFETAGGEVLTLEVEADIRAMGE